MALNIIAVALTQTTRHIPAMEHRGQEIWRKTCFIEGISVNLPED